MFTTGLLSANPLPPFAPHFGYPFDDSAYLPSEYYDDYKLDTTGWGIFNAKLAYGAAGDGSTDDTAAIRAAAAAGESFVSGGGPGAFIYLPQGTYNVCPQYADGNRSPKINFTLNTSTGLATVTSGSIANLCPGDQVNFTSATGSDGGATMPSGGAATPTIHTTALYIGGTAVDGTVTEPVTGGFFTGSTFYFYDTAAHAIAGGSTGKQIWSSAGSGLAIGDQPYGSIFNIASNNIVFIGDGGGTDVRGSLTKIVGYCYKLLDPATNWVMTQNGSPAYNGRYFLFKLPEDLAKTGFQVRSIDIPGTASSWTPSHPGDFGRRDGQGWDENHKCFLLSFAPLANSTIVANSTIRKWFGEQVYAGGDAGAIDCVNLKLLSTNADAISCAGKMTARYLTIGGATADDDVDNGFENLAFGAGDFTIVDHCTIQPSSGAEAGNGVVLFCNDPDTYAEVTNSTITNANSAVWVGQQIQDLAIQNNALTGNIYGITLTFQSTQDIDNGMDSILIDSNSFAPSQNYGAALLFSVTGSTSDQNITNLTISNCSISTRGTLLRGTFGGTKGGWTNFNVTNCMLGAGSNDVIIDGNPDNFALWSGTIRPGSLGSSTWLNTSGALNSNFSFSGSGLSGSTFTQGVISSDLTGLGANDLGGAIAFDLLYDVNAYPDGFTTLFYQGNGATNWTIKANSAWNTLVSDQTVGPSGVTFKKVSGKFVKQ